MEYLICVFWKFGPTSLLAIKGLEDADLHPRVALAENKAKFVPRPSQVAPSG
jgi:hypothetical protein